MIPITDKIQIAESELSERFVYFRGPGGQNVNKVATTVQLRFDVGASPNLTDDVKQRLRQIAGRRVDKHDVLLIRARRHRTLERNRRDARERLFELIRRAAERKKPRKRRHGESRAARAKRLAAKRRRSETKQLRSRPTIDS